VVGGSVVGVEADVPKEMVGSSQLNRTSAVRKIKETNLALRDILSSQWYFFELRKRGCGKFFF